MTLAAMAALHAAAFPDSRPWSPEEIAGLIEAPGGFAVTAAQGFALGRAIAGEAELITIAVAPAARREGTGRGLLVAFEAEARARGAACVFLEVADNNAAALALYIGAGWTETGRRHAYYKRAGRAAVDALTLAKRLRPV